MKKVYVLNKQNQECRREIIKLYRNKKDAIKDARKMAEFIVNNEEENELYLDEYITFGKAHVFEVKFKYKDEVLTNDFYHTVYWIQKMKIH